MDATQVLDVMPPSSMCCRASQSAECVDQAGVLKADGAMEAGEDPEAMETGTITGTTDDAKSIRGAILRYADSLCNACRAVSG